MFDTILLDVDGTLMDTEYVMTRSLQQTLVEEQQREVPIERLQFILGIPGSEAVQSFAKHQEDREQLLSAWQQNVRKLSNYATLFPGVQLTLKKLKMKNKKLGIITSKTTTEMQQEFAPFNLNPYFDVIITASDTALPKPSPEPLQQAMDTLKATKDTSIYIGDSIYDMQSANACGIAFGLAKWGALDKPEFEHVEFQFKQPHNILDLV